MRTKRITAMIMAFVFGLLLTSAAAPQPVQAASKYITVNEFAKQLSKEIDIAPVTE